ncbi:MAG: short chain dehydrogenase [Sneathiella sp.]|jgi:citronellol/citronellal dehydrogenase|uniref:SDR family oxidoreductase n=1 Tax=Sneathiella sp. TaxID=1964365 RepID=UPI000C618135|nr:NAD(P)-dependent oxidoreductase [Sneathiella sp.]MAL78380.1 short chain dehydrogenase [Sneathiella sp.]
MADLAGKTLFITGASRGIGLAIGKRAAADGANVVIAAKTDKPHKKLSGTIHSAAAEIEAAGGRALPLVVDVREEAVVEAAMAEAARVFGGIDILVNNASAISLTGTLETPMKRYDLMHQINVRGTYLCSQKAIPYLKKSDNPHVLNLSPPLNFEAHWFSPHVAYSMAKYGMSLCVLGMADEFKKAGIAFNALWPRTAIATAAIDMIGGGADIRKRCRKVEIMADAAHVILTRTAREFTGNFCIDDEVLREAGVTDFAKYRHEGVDEADLLPDFFV